MESTAISPHQVRIYNALKAAGRWMTNRDIKDAAGGVADRTVRLHTERLVALRLIDQMELSGGYRFRWTEATARRNPTYRQRLEDAARAFGASIQTENAA